MSDLHDANRQSWNHATRVHNAHKRDQAAFLRGGGSTLFPEEVALLGDLEGKRLVHLQCNAGQDTLSLARLGADVTGVDLSDEAIGFAGQLAADSGIPATFARQEVVAWMEASPGGYDVAFSSYGTTCWLDDLAPWAAGIGRILRPGGVFVYVEFHPLAFSFDDQFRASKDPYFAPGRVFVEPVGNYVEPPLAPSGFVAADDPPNPHPAHAFQWTVADVVTALAQAGLVLERLEEYPFMNGCRLVPTLVEKEGRRLYPPDGIAAIPLMYGLRARRP